MSRARSTAADAQGFILVEVLVAVIVLVVGLLATLMALDASSHLNLTSQRQQAAMSAAEQSMEQLRATPYASLGLSSLPVHSTDGNLSTDHSGNPANPDYWVSGTNLVVAQNWNSESSSVLAGTPTAGEPLVSGGTISPGPVTISSEGFTGTAYRFVSWVDDKCVYLAVDLCPGTHDAKRVTIAVVVGGGGTGVRKPVWLSTVVADPQAGLG